MDPQIKKHTLRLINYGLFVVTASDGDNVAAGSRTTVNEIARAIADLTGQEAKARYDPPRTGDVRHSLADLSRARDELGYEPTVDLEQGLERCLTYYRSLFG